MGAPLVSRYMFEQIRELSEQGLSGAGIARKLELDPKTVAKYLKSNTPPKYKKRVVSTRADLFSEFAERIKTWIERTPTLTDREVFELLLVEGYAGSERTINRKVKLLRQTKSAERFFEQEYQPGEQAQFDFKEKVELPFLSGAKIVHLHFGTLPFSNKCVIKAYPFKNYECFMDGVHSFFEAIGGVTENIRFDNLSPVVKEVLKDGGRLYTDAFKRAHAYYGFGLLPCRPAKGSDKGDVERDIRTFSSRIKNRVSHEGVVFRDFDHANEYLKLFMELHQKAEVKLLLITEKEKLKPLPSKEELVLCKVIDQRAGPYGNVRFGKSAYSVKDGWIEKECRVLVGAYTVKIYQGSNPEPEIHERKPDGEHSLKLEHVIPSLVRKPHAMIRWAHRSILFPDPICAKFYQRLKNQNGQSAEREYLRTLNLVLQIALSEITVAMELAMDTASSDLFESVRELLFGERKPANVFDLSEKLNMKPIKPELSGYDSFIPKGESG